jgi:CheY-like chemotaxis protein
MKWHNAARDFLPDTSRSVLISLKGVYHISFFDKEKGVFTFSDGGLERIVLKSVDIYWTDIDHIPKPKTRTVLIIEDDPDDQQLISSEIKKAMPSVHIEIMSDGEEAIKYLLKRPPYKHGREPDLILLDLNLPKVDGFEILKEIARHDRLKDTIVFVVSTGRSTEQWNKALNLGARCFFSKGSSSKEVSRIVQEICANLN